MDRVRARFPSSLRWRLTAWVAGVLVAVLAVVFAVVYLDTGTELRGQIDRDVIGDTAQLSQSLRPLHGQSAAQISTAAARYVTSQPYRATSTLLFMIIPGAATASNHPELFAATAAEDGDSAARQAKENAQARQLLVPRPGYSTQPVPDVGPVRILERTVTVGHVELVVAAGEPLATVTAAQHGVVRTFLLAGAAAILLALIASYLAGARVSAPLRRLAAIARRIDAGDLEPRIQIDRQAGGDVYVLAEAFNHMLDRLAEAFGAQREFIADASHELRTPLTVMKGQLELLAAQHPADADLRRVEQLVQTEINRIGRLVNDLLLLAQADTNNFLHIDEVDLGRFVDDIWDGVSLTAERRYELGPVPRGTLHADPDRLAQALRNLANNAIDHTTPETGLVRLKVDRIEHDRIRFAVTDNGPGIPPAERERIFERFHRTDQGRSRAAGGAGLGLAIVRAIALAHHGTVHAGDSSDGRGARVELVLPGFQAPIAPTAVAQAASHDPGARLAMTTDRDPRLSARGECRSEG